MEAGLYQAVGAAAAAAHRSGAAWRAHGSERARHHHRGRRAGRRVQDVRRRRNPVLHAGPERAVPLDLRLEPVTGRRSQQPAAAGEGQGVPVRGGHHFLIRDNSLRRFDFQRLILVPVLALGAIAAGCSDNNTSTVTPTPPVQLSETFTGSVSVNGAFTHPFQVTRAGSVTAQITALSPDDTVRVGIALGTWNGSACQLIIANDAATLSTAVNGTATAPGTLCVRMSTRL